MTPNEIRESNLRELAKFREQDAASVAGAPDERPREARCSVATGSDFWDELLESLRLMEEGYEKVDKYSCAFCCQEARRRLINQRSHMEALHKALDGLPINHIPGAGMDGHRDARNLRAVVEHLLSQNTKFSGAPAAGRSL